jgi:hypothetical protein
VEEKVKRIAIGVQLIGLSKQEPAQRDRYFEAVGDLRDALTTLQVRTQPHGKHSQIWIGALTQALKFLDRVIALPVLKPGATPDYRLEPIDQPLTRRDHELLALSVRPLLADLLKRAKSPGFKPLEAANDDSVASMLAAVEHRGLLDARTNLHKAQLAMRMSVRGNPVSMREATAHLLGDALRKISAIAGARPGAALQQLPAPAGGPPERPPRVAA